MSAVTLLSLTAMRALPDADLLAYATEIGDDDAAWDEISERGCDRLTDCGEPA